uniref:U6 snRNA phosphodiesterase 1 n=1 Tax=Schistosoma haematobium TaxID=6185 RepID=A0A095ATR7_SCHHA
MNTQLVEYSSSDEEETEKLELPTILQDLNSDSFRFFVREDDPSKHDFRSRTFPHEPGSWATSVSFFTLVTSEESRIALISLLNSVDSCVTAFRGPKYYENPKFHMSFLWCNGDVRKKYSTETLNNFLMDLRKAIFVESKQISHEVTDIVCKSGKKYFDINIL